MNQRTQKIKSRYDAVILAVEHDGLAAAIYLAAHAH